MSFLVTTTGIQGTITLDDLGGRTLIHPTSGLDLELEYDIDELRQSSSLQSAIDSGWITATWEGNSITNLSFLQADEDIFSDSQSGLVPISPGGNITFLRADGTWATPSGIGLNNIVEDLTPQLGGDLDAQGIYGIDNLSYLHFDLNTSSPQITAGEAQLTWNSDERTLDLGDGSTVLQIGQEIHYNVRNNSGSTITNGTAVMATGTLGSSGRITIDEFVNDGSIAPYYFLGIATEDISNDADGKITHFGKVRGIQTDGVNYGETWVDGDLLYLNPTTSGGLSKNQPDAPAHKTPIAIVIHAQSTNGTLFVRVENDSYINQLADVQIVTPLNNEVLVYNASTIRWENTALTKSIITDYDAIANLVEDVTPQLGGNLDVQSNLINTSIVDGNISIQPNGTGNVILGNFTFDGDQTVGAGQDNYVLTYDNTTGLISLEEASAGSGNVATDTIWDVQGDLVVGTGDNTAVRLPIGSAGTFLRSDATTAAWSVVSFPNSAATGDILYASSTNNYDNLGPGTSGQVLTSNGPGVAPSYQNAPGGGNSRIAGSVSTIDATLTTLDSIDTLTTDATHIIEVWITARETGSNSEWGVWKRSLAVTNFGGTVTVQQVSSDFDKTSTGLKSNDVSFSVNGTSVDIQVTGIAATNIDWDSNYEIITIS